MSLTLLSSARIEAAIKPNAEESKEMWDVRYVIYSLLGRVALGRRIPSSNAQSEIECQEDAN